MRSRRCCARTSSRRDGLAGIATIAPRIALVGVVVGIGASAAADPALHRIADDDETIAADTASRTLAIKDAYRETEAQHHKQWQCSLHEMTNVIVGWSCDGVVDDGVHRR